jgi:hypothetical protein
VEKDNNDEVEMREKNMKKKCYTVSVTLLYTLTYFVYGNDLLITNPTEQLTEVSQEIPTLF